ncbi:uncharacterized protein [Diadema setosum]|uniref:uncharacterized protein n=1 Tax=Diadema setosum TaxID=31175 RepID=UPI003B3B605A
MSEDEPEAPSAVVSDDDTSTGGPSGGMVAGATIGCLLLFGIVLGAALCCLWWRKRQSESSHVRESGEIKQMIARQSSTLRSDKSDHPYENPSLTPAQAKAIDQRIAKSEEQYMGLRGHSLPHHYEGLGAKSPTSGNIPTQDDLLESTESGSGGYYFKIDPSVRGSKGDKNKYVGPTAQEMNDNPYDEVKIGAQLKQNKRESSNEKESNYYFRLEQPVSKSDSWKVQNANQTNNNDNGEAFIKGDGYEDSHTTSGNEAPLISGPTAEEMDSSYDRLDRSEKRVFPQEGDRCNGNEYSKLLPRLAVQNGQAPPTGQNDYLRVQPLLGSNSDRADDSEGETSNGGNDYNELDRGVEREFQKLSAKADEAKSSEGDASYEVPAEL